MPYEIIDNRDALWQKFKVESYSKDLISTSAEVQGLADAVLLMHKKMPLQWLMLSDSPPPWQLELRFIDGKAWIVHLHERVLKGAVSYDLDNTTQWLRADVIEFITLVTDKTILAFVAESVDKIDMRPR